MAHQQESFLPFFSRQSLSCCLSRVAKRSTPKPRGPLPFPSEQHGPLFISPKLPDPGPLSFPSEPRGSPIYFRTTWTSIYLLAPEPRGSPIYFRTAWSSLFTLEPRGLLSPPPKPCGPPYYFWSRVVSPSLQSRMVSSSLPKTLWSSLLLWSCVVSSFLPQNLLVLPRSAIPASIPVFFQLYWAAIVSLGRCGPMAWSQSSLSSPTGPVTRGSCFPVPSWVEFGPIPLAQSRATAI